MGSLELKAAQSPGYELSASQVLFSMAVNPFFHIPDSLASGNAETHPPEHPSRKVFAGILRERGGTPLPLAL